MTTLRLMPPLGSPFFSSVVTFDGVLLMMLTVTPPALPSTPRLPDGIRFSGTTASGPASPISPMPRAIGKSVGRLTTPPRANGITLP